MSPSFRDSVGANCHILLIGPETKMDETLRGFHKCRSRTSDSYDSYVPRKLCDPPELTKEVIVRKEGQ
jgi:hypothetical protein